jgi:hypothetical protein
MDFPYYLAHLTRSSRSSTALVTAALLIAVLSTRAPTSRRTTHMDTFDRLVEAGIADPDLDGPPTYPVRIYRVKVGTQHG